MAAIKVEKGVSFPIELKDKRSTTITGAKIIAAAIRGSGLPEAENYAARCEKEKKWRYKYQSYYYTMVKLSAASPEAALGVARAGIKYMHENFLFIDPANPENVESFASYMSKPVEGFFTGVIEGESKETRPLIVPYKGKNLTGEALKAQLTKWASYGTIEPDAAASISKIAEKKLDLKDHNFILIGAGSAMGPFNKVVELFV